MEEDVKARLFPAERNEEIGIDVHTVDWCWSLSRESVSGGSRPPASSERKRGGILGAGRPLMEHGMKPTLIRVKDKEEIDVHTSRRSTSLGGCLLSGWLAGILVR